MEATLEKELDNLRAAARESNAHVVEAIVSISDVKVPVVAVDATDLAELIRAVRPRVVYCHSVRFSAEEQVLFDLSEGEDLEEALSRQSAVRQLIKRWRVKDDELAQLASSVMVDGVLHIVSLEPSWYPEFEADIEAHRADVETLRGEAERRQEAEVRRRLDPLVRKLMEDHRFSGPKVGRSKRQALAEELFPEADAATIADVVALAENRYWLQKA